jgi:anthranilate phosphoribosyltransferase
MIKDCIKQMVEGQDLPYEKASTLMQEIISGESTDAQIGSALTALRMKGETPQEISAFASVMRKYCNQIHPRVSGRLVDTCGTGGDRLKTFNISTISAFVIAGVGGYVAKHGNRSFTSKCGSADVLENLGVNLLLKPSEVEQLIEDIGIGFIYAPVFHPAMKYAIGPRRELGIRSVFNVLGPLTNPAAAKAQLLGVYSQKLTEPIAQSLKLLGCEEAMVVHGIGGMDEISTIGETAISWLKEGIVKNLVLTPRDFGVESTTHDEIRGSNPDESAEILFKVLNGQEDAPRTEIVLVNGVAGIIVAGKTDEFSHAMEMARQSIDSGAAYSKLKNLVKASGGNLTRLEELETKYA